MHAAAAEAGRLARRVEAGNGVAVGPEHAALEVGLKPAERLAGEQVEPDGDQRPGLRVEQPVRLGDARDLVGEVLPRHADRHDLRVLGVRVRRPRGRAPATSLLDLLE